jgi:small subunit ribosomal protein S17
MYKILSGFVSKIIDQRTVSITVEKKFRHPLYGKVISLKKKYLVDKTDSLVLNVGDLVCASHVGSISKKKKWKILS